MATKVRIGKISKNEEEYYFAFDMGKWRQVRIKDKVWHSLRSVKYIEGVLDEEDGTLIKRVYKRSGKVFSVDYFVKKGDSLVDLECRSASEFNHQQIEVCRYDDITIYKYGENYFEDKESLLRYLTLQIRRDIEGKLGSERITLEAKLKGETEKAYLAVINKKEVWIPKSISEYADGKITLPLWYVKNNKLADTKEFEIKVDSEVKKYEDELSKIIFEL
ncbi:hypothetical protein [Stygiolobus caldivivus]|uniref:Uncharacterized protein n=1 Tax=Stygiolobus caldivivus TaxID=2824673 RepID=A0A8D5U5A9_9CREN|nr:hypothetical protein [Stygiolobus caldivivus]BCU69559.1 hypothetical protein KN1_08560 [Stygiolobus caldivivus]